MDITNLEESLNPNPNPNNNQTKDEEEDAGLRAGRIANAMAFPMVLKAALQIGVIDTISAAGDGAWLSPSEIALRLPTRSNKPCVPMLLDRMMCLLASYQILKFRTVQAGPEIERVYAVEPICRFFLNNSQDSGSLAPLFMLLHSDVIFKTWNHLKDTITEGRDAFSSAHGTRLYEYLGRDEPFRKLFHRAMSEHSIMIMKKILEVYRGFEGVNLLVDVGGGDGTSLGLITSKYPSIRGINFDLLTAIQKAHSYPGVEHVVGDMFVEIPKGDTIFMKRIVQDWNDEDCLKILRNCWKSLPNKGRVIIVDPTIPLDPEGGDVYSNVVLDMDMLMCLLCSGGRGRTQTNFEELAKKAGFTRCEFIIRVFYCWIIELHKDVEMLEE